MLQWGRSESSSILQAIVCKRAAILVIVDLALVDVGHLQSITEAGLDGVGQGVELD